MHNIFFFGLRAAPLAAMCALASCTALEKASRHGFDSGYYQVKEGKGEVRRMYVEVTQEGATAYPLKDGRPDADGVRTIMPASSDTALEVFPVLRKNSLDVDITAIPMKFRPAVSGMPAQMITDFNFALYAGWRRDHFRVTASRDPLGRVRHALVSRGYDVGLFAGPGATEIGPFTTRQRQTNEYSGMILQAGIAGFVETDWMSFGIAAGADHLLSEDRVHWIYHHKPWVGFIVGVAIN